MKRRNPLKIELIPPAQMERLRSAAGNGPVLILTHNNPDPDALASGKALGTILLKAWDIPSRMVYSGLVARAENKAMLDLLTPEWEQKNILSDVGQFSAIALVDTQPGAGNNNLPDKIIPHIVIDHHQPLRTNLERVAFFDVRPEVGATASLVYQYLHTAGIVPDAKLATAIFYGIKADTRSLSRGDSQLDQAVYFELLKLIDRDHLVLVEQAGLPRDYYRALSNGLQSTCVYGNVVIAFLGEMHRPDFMAEMADLLVRMDGTQVALCQGYHRDVMYLSLRTASIDYDANRIIQAVIVDPGKAGGHGSTAGGQIPLNGRMASEVAGKVERRFLDFMGKEHEGERLLC